jgi:hypothetical protein
MGPDKVASNDSSSADDGVIGIWEYALDRIDKQLEIELNLINARMSWLVISESFLFNAFVGAGSESIRPPGAGLAIQVAMVVIGFVIAKSVKSAVEAALEVIEERKKERRPLEICLLNAMKKHVRNPELQLPSVDRDDPRHKAGSVPARYIPASVMYGWVALAVVWLCRVAWLWSTGRLRA